MRTLIAPVRHRVTFAAALEAVSSVAQVIPAIAAVEIARRLVHDGAGAAVWWWTAVAAAGLVTALACGTAASVIAHLSDADLGLHLRLRITQHIARLPLGWFSSRAAQQVQTLVQDDVAGLHEDVAHARPELIGSITGSVTILCYLLYADWRLGVITIVLVTFGQLIRRHLGAAIIEPFAKVAAAAGRMSAAAVELVHGVVESKVFATGTTARSGAARHFRDAADEFIEIDESLTRTFATKRACTRATVAAPTVTLVLLAVTVLLENAASVDPVDVVAFLLLGLALFDSSADLYFYVVFPALQLTVPNQRKGPAMAGRIGALLDQPPLTEPDPPAQLPAPRISGGRTVRFDAVDFSYDGERNVLRHLDLELAPGTVTALVGPSGAGKSTVGQLLARFYDPAAGQITIDGVALSLLSTEQLYRTVGFVFQDVQLLRASIRDNLVLGRQGATDAQVERVARAAAIHDRIMSLPDGYDTVIGEGISLSGGERQRLSIARTLLADTPVLVLDEATASADPESEAAIQDALSVLTKGRTLLVVAHRLHTVVDADVIAVLDSGTVIEQGTHHTLLDRGGSYASLWNAQHERVGA
nr:ABC transporter ATP-binding protein [Flexivirga oryzae]